jgi:hypothetical protein
MSEWAAYENDYYNRLVTWRCGHRTLVQRQREEDVDYVEEQAKTHDCNGCYSAERFKRVTETH